MLKMHIKISFRSNSKMNQTVTLKDKQIEQLKDEAQLLKLLNF